MRTAPKSESSKKSLKKQAKKNKRDKKSLAFGLCKTMPHYFPDLSDRIREMEDWRKNKNYGLAELAMAALMTSVLKKESRNASDNEREDENSEKNYGKISEVRLPHADTTDKVMREPKERESERLKTVLAKNLLEKRTFHKYRLSGGYHGIAVGGTHVMTVNEGHYDNMLRKPNL